MFRSIKPLFLAIRNPEVGTLLRAMRKDLSHNITEFVNEHADIILPDDEKQPSSNNEKNDIHIETQEIEIQEVEQPQQQQQQEIGFGTQEIVIEEENQDMDQSMDMVQSEMESIVILTEDDNTMPSQDTAVANSNNQTVEAY